MVAAPAAGIALPPNAPANVDARVKQLEQQYRPQFKQLLDVELAFVRRVCEPDPSQRELVAKAGEQCMTAVLTKCAAAQIQMENGGFRPGSQPNPRGLLQEQFADALTKSLRPEQVERYRRESQQRTASRRRAVVHYMIAKADQTLAFSSEQREKLTQTLLEHYSDDWEQAIPLWMHNPQFVPAIPNRWITPLLNEKQQSVRRGIPESNGFFAGMNWMVSPNMAVIQEQQ